MKRLLLIILPLVMASMAFSQAPLEIYGVTNTGGPDGIGGICKASESGDNMQILHPFKKHRERASVNGTPIEPVTGFIYGMTSLGGKNDEGVIYEYEISNGGFVIRHSFNAAVTGKNPNGSLYKASNGKLYGMTKAGGSADKGVIFEYDLSTHAVQKLYDFNGTDGEAPMGSLIQSADGKLYGMTTAGGVNSKGVIFRYDIVSGTYEKLLDFDGTNNGSAPRGDLLEASNGLMYAFTYNGGANNYGVMFSFDKSTLAYTKILDLTSVTRNPTGSFIQSTSGLIYGIAKTKFFRYNPTTEALDMFACEGDGTPVEKYGEIFFTSKTASGAYLEVGTLCKFTNGVTVVDHFTTNTQWPNFSAGTRPCNGLLWASDGLLYGITAQDADYHGGALYATNGLSNQLRGKVMFDIQSPIGKSTSNLVEVDKKLYGIGSGGRYNDGTIYRYDMETDSLELMLDFNTSFGIQANMNDLDISLVKHPNGKLYAFVPGGTSYSGFLMEYVPGSNTYTNIYNNALVNNGPGYIVRLTVGQDGLLYGVTSIGGTNNYGVIFSFDLATSTYTVLHNFTDNPTYRNLELTQLSNGIFYGITGGDANGDASVIYSFDPATGTYQELSDLNNFAARFPAGPLVEGLDGKLYAGFMYPGAIISFDPSTSTSEQVFTFDGANTGSAPGTLAVGSNGKLYGFSRYYQFTKFFELDAETSDFTVKHEFLTEELGIDNYYGLAKICKLIPDISELENAEICYGSTFSKTSSISGPTMTYQWIKDGTDIPGATDSTLTMTVSDSDEGLYYCLVNNGCRWIYSDSVELTVLPLPIVNAGADQHICLDSIAVLTADGDAASYAWSGNVIDNTPFNVFFDSTYILTGTGANGCVNTDTVSIFVSPAVDAGPDITTCMFSSVTLTASGDATTYTWSENVEDGVAFIAEETHEYILTGVNAEGCVNIDTMLLTVLPLPVVNAGLDTSVCFSSPATFHASGNAATYVWSDNIIDATPFIAEADGEYILTGTDAEGCVNTDTLLLSVIVTVVDAGADLHICHDSVAVLNASGTATSYTWNNGVFGGVPFTVTENSQYIVMGVGPEGCVNSDTVQIFISPLVYAGQDTSVCMASPATFHASGDAVSYTWSDNVTDGEAFIPSQTQIYVLTGVDAEGCISTDTLLLTIDNCLTVWPGDTDNDYEVGSLDFFNVGLNFGATGDPRSAVSSDWAPQTSNLWNTTMTAGSGTGLDHAYADCNGDGVINYDDTLAVNQNFALFHTLKPTNGQAAHLDEYGTIFFSSAAQEYGANQLVTIDIHAGTADQAFDQVYGLAFDVNYTATGIVPGSLHIQMNDQSWLGEVATNAIRLGADNAEGTAYLGLCRTNHTNVSSFGVIGKVTFLTATQDGNVTLSVSNAMQTDANGELRDLESESYAVTIDPTLKVADQENQLECKVYPNPSKGLFNIAGLRPGVEYTLVIRDITGKLVHASKIMNQTQFDAKLSTGSYLLEISNGNSVYREQVVVSNQ